MTLYDIIWHFYDIIWHYMTFLWHFVYMTLVYTTGYVSYDHAVTCIINVTCVGDISMIHVYNRSMYIIRLSSRYIRYISLFITMIYTTLCHGYIWTGHTVYIAEKYMTYHLNVGGRNKDLHPYVQRIILQRFISV